VSGNRQTVPEPIFVPPADMAIRDMWRDEMLKRGITSRFSRLSSHRVPDHHVFSLYKPTPNSWAWPCVDADDERCSRSAMARCQAGATAVAHPNGRWMEVGSIAALANAPEITVRHLSCYGRFRGR
jgi:hypothetical protein